MLINGQTNQYKDNWLDQKDFCWKESTKPHKEVVIVLVRNIILQSPKNILKWLDFKLPASPGLLEEKNINAHMYSNCKIPIEWLLS